MLILFLSDQLSEIGWFFLFFINATLSHSTLVSPQHSGLTHTDVKFGFVLMQHARQHHDWAAAVQKVLVETHEHLWSVWSQGPLEPSRHIKAKDEVANEEGLAHNSQPASVSRSPSLCTSCNITTDLYKLYEKKETALGSIKAKSFNFRPLLQVGSCHSHLYLKQGQMMLRVYKGFNVFTQEM